MKRLHVRAALVAILLTATAEVPVTVQAPSVDLTRAIAVAVQGRAAPVRKELAALYDAGGPVALAEWALKGQTGWTRERILAAMDGPRPVQVNLTRPIQVILFYVTAAVMPDDGSVHFAQDIYGHDARLDRALRRTSVR